MSRWLLAPDHFSDLRELGPGGQGARGQGARGPGDSGRGLSRCLRLLFLLLLQSQLLNYMQMAIDNMAQQCCSSNCVEPKSMGLFSKLNLIQVTPPCFPDWPNLSRFRVHSWLAPH